MTYWCYAVKIFPVQQLIQALSQFVCFAYAPLSYDMTKQL